MAKFAVGKVSTAFITNLSFEPMDIVTFDMNKLFILIMFRKS